MELVSLVRLEGVAKHVILPDDTRLDILRGIDLEIAAGDHVAIVGRSGSGKSTLLNLMGMLDAPDDGDVVSRGDLEVDAAEDVEARVIGQDDMLGDPLEADEAHQFHPCGSQYSPPMPSS